VTKIQAGLATPTNITAAAGIALSATQAAYAPAKAGDKMDLIDVPNATGISAIVTAINSLATYGLTALNTLLVTTGIKAATIPAATLAANQHVIVDSGTVTTLTNAPSDPSGVTELLTRIPDATAGAAGGLPTVAAGGVKLAQTVDLTAGQQIDITDTTVAEMVQGAPPASPTIKQMLNYLYRKLRNKQETTATVNSVYDDAGTTILFKETHSDDATTFAKGKYGTGA
jgi:hypothetical protein